MRGFTVVELLIVLGIIGLLASVAIPRFVNSLARRRADAAAQRIVSDLQLAQRAAQQSSRGLRVIFNPSAGTYTLDGLSDPDRGGSTYVVDLGQPPYEVLMRSADFGGDATLVFDGFGQPDSGGSVIVGAGDEWRLVSLPAESGSATVTEVRMAPPAPIQVADTG